MRSLIGQRVKAAAFQRASFALAISLITSQMSPAENETKPDINSARQLIKEHHYKQADSLLASLEAKAPQDAALCILRGDLFREIGQIENAKEEFAKASELSLSDPVPMVVLAELSLKQLELDMSLSYAQQAVARDPAYLPARISLVNILLQCEQTGEAERQLKYLARTAKDSPEIELLAYKLCLKKGDFAAAREHLQKAISNTHETNIQLRLEQADLLQSMGDYLAAKTELEKIAASNPDSLSARLRLARLLELQFHDYAGALSNFNEALKLDPLSAPAIAGRDRCQVKRRNIALQIKLFLREYWSKSNQSK